MDLLKKYTVDNKGHSVENENANAPPRLIHTLMQELVTPVLSSNKLQRSSFEANCFGELDRNGSLESNKITSESDADGTSSAEVDNTEVELTGLKADPVKV